MNENINSSICWNASVNVDSEGNMTRLYTVGFENGNVIVCDVDIEVAKKLRKILGTIIDYDSATNYNVRENEAPYGK